MALVSYSLEIVKGILDELELDKRKSRRILTLSNPDILATVGEVERIFGKRVEGRLKVRNDSNAIYRWHKVKHITREIVDTVHLFSLLGYDMDAVDIVESRGGEIIHDMNLPIPKQWHDRYDLVFDQISNQCFNIAQVMASAALACRCGGYVVHVIPVTQVNQGFYGVSPTAYQDFYKANHFAMRSCRTVVDAHELHKELNLRSYLRHRDVPDDAMNVIVAQKMKGHPGKIRWPIMHKFTVHPLCLTHKKIIK